MKTYHWVLVAVLALGVSSWGVVGCSPDPDVGVEVEGPINGPDEPGIDEARLDFEPGGDASVQQVALRVSGMS